MTYENSEIEKLLSRLDRNIEILEVGSGFGLKTQFLKSLGFTNVLGVEKNVELVKKARQGGDNVLTLDEFENSIGDKKFDVLFLSHIVEHFQYENLKEFLEYYFGFVKDSGYVLIATPVFNNCFYDDFDHVKPYSHVGILSVFGSGDSQVQFYSDYQLELIDIRFIKLAYQIRFYRTLVMRGQFYRIPRIINQLLHLVYRVSFRLIGRPVSWVGLFEKTTRVDETAQSSQ